MLVAFVFLGPIVATAHAPRSKPGERVIKDYHEAAKGFITVQYRVTKNAEDTGRYSCCEDGELPGLLQPMCADESLPVRVADAFGAADEGGCFRL